MPEVQTRPQRDRDDCRNCCDCAFGSTTADDGTPMTGLCKPSSLKPEWRVKPGSPTCVAIQQSKSTQSDSPQSDDLRQRVITIEKWVRAMNGCARNLGLAYDGN